MSISNQFFQQTDELLISIPEGSVPQFNTLASKIMNGRFFEIYLELVLECAQIRPQVAQ